MKIGFCGLGRMGKPMCRRLLLAGHELHVWNRSPAASRELAESDARVSESPLALARACPQLVILCLFDAAAVRQVVFGPEGLAQASELQLVVDHSTMGPGDAQRIAVELRQANGADWLDAPVSGGTQGAADGTLAIMLGGAPGPAAEISPVLQAYARQVTHMGPLGSGQTAKMFNQAIVASTIASLAESLAMAQAAGINVARLPQALAGGWADSVLLQYFVPRMLSEEIAVQASVATFLKDLDAVTELAAELDASMPMANTARQAYQQAVQAGYGPQDASRLIRLHDPAQPVGVPGPEESGRDESEPRNHNL